MPETFRKFVSSKRSFILWMIMGMLACSKPPNNSSFVDVFIGTGGHGHTYPGATSPFGMIQASPVNGTAGWDWVSGYHYSDSIITGFTQTHLSGTGIGDLNDVLIMPTNKMIGLNDSSKYFGKRSYASLFSHQNESASPGFYSVYLDDFEINAEMTATERVAMYRFNFQKDDAQFINLDIGYSINWDSMTEGYFKIKRKGTHKIITGYRRSTGWAKEQNLYFALQFSKDFAIEKTIGDSINANLLTIYGSDRLFSILEFEGDGDELLAKIAISAHNEEGALANLATLKGWDFDSTKTSVEQNWSEELAKIEVNGDPDKKKIFYTALYHSKLAPVLFSDANESKTSYTIYSLWDTFRAQHPLLTITNPERVDDMILTMLDFYQQKSLLPVWELHGYETGTMTGYHAVPVILDAYLKGFKGFDAELAFEAMKASAMQNQRDSDLYRKYQYIPSDLTEESVTKTLEYAFDDWCIAQMALALNKQDEYSYFLKRSKYWQNLYDSETKFMRGKNVDGTWTEPFNPLFSSHRENTDYTEGNAWQHSWFVPHQVDKLIEMMGGDAEFITRLDSLFNQPSIVVGEDASPDISGLIGQYAHGNEPSHHIAYLYSYAGAPWKSQQILNKIMDTQYSTNPDGLSGNENAGQMSAWYVFSAMGFYPVNPTSGKYVLGVPQFDEVQINLPQNKQFTIFAENLSEVNRFVQAVILNGENLNRSYITHKELIAGGNLTFVMGKLANKDWGKSPQNRPIN